VVLERISLILWESCSGVVSGGTWRWERSSPWCTR